MIGVVLNAWLLNSYLPTMISERAHCFFRVDASPAIGSGHFMRCLTLARALARRGASITFLCKHLPFFFQEQLDQHEFRLHRLNTENIPDPCGDLAHSSWLGTSQEDDAMACLNALFRTPSEIATAPDKNGLCIVDHYALDVRWERLMRQAMSTIMVIDDLADRPHDCDILLDQNFIPGREKSYLNKTPTDCKLLLGPKYALLRDEFSKLRHSIVPRNGQVHRILIFLGGIDRDNYTGMALRALKMLKKNLLIDVVIGAGNPHRDDVEALCETLQARCHVQSERMAELMARSDFAIGAAGSATWERCCLGVPSLLFVLAQNQRPIASSLQEHGACVLLDDCDLLDENQIANILEKLFKEPQRIREISQKAYELVDGQGCKRIVQCLFDSGR